MTNYSVTFANGRTKEIKNSKREYAFAWQVVTDNSFENGFAADKAKAEAAVKSAVRYQTRYGAKLVSSEIISL